MRACKGQIFTIDFIAGLSAFILVLSLVLLLSSNVNSRVNDLEAYAEMENSSSNAVNQLALSVGEPINWNYFSDLNSVHSIGIARERNVLDKNKVQWLVDKNSSQYTAIKETLGLGKYGLGISVQDLEGKELKKFGLDAGKEQQVVLSERYVLFDGNLCKLKVKVFK